MESLLAVTVLLAVILVVMMSIILHEIAHGWVAAKCGDYTAEAAGRLTLNPIKHIDPFMTIMLPIFLLFITKGQFTFGGAKPVPINPFRFRNLKRDYFFVSVAGLAVNLCLALFFALLIRVNLFPPDRWGAPIVWYGMWINLLLFSFNLLPIPPLDGSRALRVFLPRQLANLFDALDRFGIFILIIVVFYTPLFNIFFTLVSLAVQSVLRVDLSEFFLVSNKFGEILHKIW